MAERNEQGQNEAPNSGSVGDIAAMLARGAMDRAEQNDAENRSDPEQERRQQRNRQRNQEGDENEPLERNSPDEGDEETDTETVEGGDDDQHSEGDDDATDDETPDESEADDEGGPEEEGEEGEEEPDVFAYDDSDTIEVTVDGEEREVTLRDLKAAYSGEGAIDKRLKEATEARKEATRLRDEAIQQHEEHRTRLLQTISQLDGALFAPMVEKPDASLRRTNRAAYDEQLDAYEDDQKRINASRQQMQQFMQQQMQEQQQNRQAYRNEQQQLLVNRAQIKTPEDAQAFQNDVRFAAEHYGFSQDQINAVDNASVFLMARDAAKYLRLQNMKETGRNSPAKGKTTNKRRKLKPGGPTSKKLAAQRQAQQKKEVTNRAKSGRVDDVASMISVNARKRG